MVECAIGRPFHIPLLPPSPTIRYRQRMDNRHGHCHDTVVVNVTPSHHDHHHHVYTVNDTYVHPVTAARGTHRPATVSCCATVARSLSGIPLEGLIRYSATSLRSQTRSSSYAQTRSRSPIVLAFMQGRRRCSVVPCCAVVVLHGVIHACGRVSCWLLILLPTMAPRPEISRLPSFTAQVFTLHAPFIRLLDNNRQSSSLTTTQLAVRSSGARNQSN